MKKKKKIFNDNINIIQNKLCTSSFLTTPNNYDLNDDNDYILHFLSVEGPPLAVRSISNKLTGSSSQPRCAS